MQSLKELFVKDYARPIETVIKADDMDHIHQEVEEFVMTTEIARKLSNFFDSYTEYDGSNGTWISGFFGSGKSHLLKILSYVLENRSINGTSLSELFASKVMDDATLKGNILNCARKFPSESILFNIDQQAQITNKKEADAILQVFYKVFYDHQGFYGFQPHVAQFESYLAKEGKYEAFCTEFRKVSGKDWTVARNDYVDPLIDDAIAEACGAVYGQDASKYEGYLDSWEDRLKFSIEDFAMQVKEYISAKPKGFRLNFFVDEVGQFIAENSKLMLNLQTIAESLNTRCKGSSWVVVTSQEDLESLVGDEKVIQSDDFSKIQGRFRIRLPLTSANVDEVLEKRLLEKNDAGKALLGNVYDREKENIKTLISFDGGRAYRGFKDTEEYISKYPFAPQHFELFQQSMKMLSKHNAFQGKHASVGERSMLGVFQEVLKALEIKDEDVLVSYDRIFEGLRSTLRGEVQNSIIQAQRQILDHPMAIRALKVLFLVKYIDSFKANLHNISVLLLDSLRTNPMEHRNQVEQALNVLEQATYIHRKGDEYEYLTDTEKDVENEIKDTPVDNQQVSHFLGEILFHGIIQDDRITYRLNKQAFEFTRKVDGIIIGRQKELTIEIVTPMSPQYENPSYFSGTSMGDNTLLLIRLAEDKRSLYEARMALKTDKYLKLSQTASSSESLRDVFREKGQQNADRKRILQTTLNGLLSRSSYFLNGSEYKGSSTSDARTKVTEAFQDLIKIAYGKLELLGAATFDEQQIRLILTKGEADLFGSTEGGISPAEQEMINFIERRKNRHERTSLNELKEQFARKPYGWSTMASWCVAALLFKHSRIEANQDSRLLDDKQFLEALNNNRAWSNTLVEPQLQFERALVNHFRDVYQQAFNESNPYNEARDAALQFKRKAAEEAGSIQALLRESANYPFLAKLDGLSRLMAGLAQMDYSTLLTSVKEWEADLLTTKQEVLDPLRQFWNGEQRRIYDEVMMFNAKHRVNYDHIDSTHKDKVSTLRDVEEPYKGSCIREAKQAMEGLHQQISEKLKQERELSLREAGKRIQEIEAKPQFRKLEPDKQQQVLRPFREVQERAATQEYIASLQLDRKNLSSLLTTQLNLMSELAAGDAGNDQPRLRFVHIREVEKELRTSRQQLETAGDVEEYLESLRAALLDRIKHNHRINLS